MKTQLPRNKKACTERSRSGFTLVELLVVIAILAILAVIGTAVFSGVQKNARDAARKSDVEAFTSALDVAKVAASTTYPSLAASMFASGALPKDPISTRNYCISWSLSSANTFLPNPATWTMTCAAGTEASGVSSAWSVPAAGAPPVDTAYGVRVCAALEDTSVVCSTTQQ